jgi:hypothetical protein
MPNAKPNESPHSLSLTFPFRLRNANAVNFTKTSDDQFPFNYGKILCSKHCDLAYSHTS